MLWRLLGLRRDTGGATAVEFALVVTPLLLLVLGIIEYGRLSWTREALQETATQAARCMGVLQTNCTSSGTYNSDRTSTYIIQTASNWGIGLSGSALTLNASTNCGGIAGFSQVTITYTFRSVVPSLLVALSGGSPLTISACFPNQATS